MSWSEQNKKLIIGMAAYGLLLNLTHISIEDKIIVLFPLVFLIPNLFLNRDEKYYRSFTIPVVSILISAGFFYILAFKYWWASMSIMANDPIENIYSLFVLTPANIYRVIGFVSATYFLFKGSDLLKKELISELDAENELRRMKDILSSLDKIHSLEDSLRVIAIDNNIKKICKQLGIVAEDSVENYKKFEKTTA